MAKYFAISLSSGPISGTITLPPDWNPTNSSIEIIGGGQAGGRTGLITGDRAGPGGRGGGYAKIINFGSAGDTLTLSGATSSAPATNVPAVGDTWLSNTGSAPTSTSEGLLARGGGSTTTQIGATTYTGGTGGAAATSGTGGLVCGGGGGGAAGPSGNGVNGGNGTSSLGGAGGAGDNSSGGAGGAASSSSGAGTGGSNGSAWWTSGNTAATGFSVSLSSGSYATATSGSGGGGAGGTGAASSGATGGNGGSAGSWGAGGGGAGYSTATSTLYSGGTATGPLIVFTYEPLSPSGMLLMF